MSKRSRPTSVSHSRACRISDHLLEKSNGHWQPDNRSNYIFGPSLPMAEENIAKAIPQLVTDLSRKAGGGPICAPDPSSALCR